MTYEVFEEQISAYIEGELNPVEMAAMDRKAAECERFGALLRDMQALKIRLSRLPQEQPSAGFNFALRSHLLMEMAKEQRAAYRVRHVLFGSTIRTVITLAAALVIGLGLTGLAPESDGPTPAQTAAVQDAEFELIPGQHVLPSDNHLGALERLSEQSFSLDSRSYHNKQDSLFGRDSMRSNVRVSPSPWLLNQDVQQVPVSF
jgi:anti-sigma factor RsiW